MWIWLLGIVIGLLVVVAFMLALSVQVELFLETEGKKLKGFIRVSYLFGLVSFRRSLHEVKPRMTDEGPAIDASMNAATSEKKTNRRIFTTEEAWKFLKEWRMWVRQFRRAIPLLRWTLRRTIITSFRSAVKLGTGEAPATGMAVGATYSVLNILVGRLSSYCVFRAYPSLVVTPDFDAAVFDLEQQCIFKIRLGYAIWAGIRSLGIWKSTRGTTHGASHSRADANSNE